MIKSANKSGKHWPI